MSNYVIITDTSADIPADILDKGQIHLIPMVYQLNGEECPHRNPGNWDSRAFMTSFVQVEPEVLPRFPRLHIPIVLNRF